MVLVILRCVMLLIFLPLLLVELSSASLHARPGMRVDIEEASWPDVLSSSGRWYIKFYAPWCDACASLAPVWQNLAASEGLPKDVHVGQVDVTRNEALAGMFLVTGLPTIYVLHDGNFWQYKGERTLPALLKNIKLAEYARTTPLPWYWSPTSLHMRALGHLIQAAVRLKQLHTHLVEVRGLPSPLAYVALALITLVGGLLAGLAIVCLCDLLVVSRGSPAGHSKGPSAATFSGDAPETAIPGSGDSSRADDNSAAASAASAVDEEDAAGDSDDLLAENGQPSVAASEPSAAVRKRTGRKERS